MRHSNNWNGDGVGHGGIGNVIATGGPKNDEE